MTRVASIDNLQVKYKDLSKLFRADPAAKGLCLQVISDLEMMKKRKKLFKKKRKK